MSNNKNKIIKNSMHLFILSCTVGVMALIRIFYMQTAKRSEYTEMKNSYKSEIRKNDRPPFKGNIYSVDGSLLATTVPYYIVAIDPQPSNKEYFDKNVDKFCLGIERIIGEQSAYELKQKLVSAKEKGIVLKKKIEELKRLKNNEHANKKEIEKQIKHIRLHEINQYILLSKNFVTHKQYLEITKLPFSNLNSKGKTGLTKKDTLVREHPFGDLARKTIGLDDPTGFFGVEAAFKKDVGGKRGRGKEKRIASNIYIPIEESGGRAPVNGKDLVLSIDMHFQDVVEAALRKKMQELDVESGCAIVMETHTGDIKALVNLGKEKPEDEYFEVNNYAVKEHFGEPGSTFKLLTLMAVLEHTKIPPNETIVNCTGKVNFNGKLLGCTHAHGPVNLRQVFETSCNVGVLQLMNKYFMKNPETYLSYLKQFRITEPVMNSQLLGEPKPDIKDMKNTEWSSLSLSRMAIGYELQVTPLQLATAYNSIANGGMRVLPRLVLEVNQNGENEVKRPIVNTGRVVSEQTAALLQDYLQSVVEEGTAKNINQGLVKIAGKTGTAIRYLNGSWNQNNQTVSFGGFFPAQQPKYTCFLMMKGTKASQNANVSVAPVFREIADKIYTFDLSMHKGRGYARSQEILKRGLRGGMAEEMNVISSEIKGVKIRGNGPVIRQNEKLITVHFAKNKMPNLKGLTLKDAMAILENQGFNVAYQGIGKVTNQSVPPGTLIARKQKILLDLN